MTRPQGMDPKRVSERMMNGCRASRLWFFAASASMSVHDDINKTKPGNRDGPLELLAISLRHAFRQVVISYNLCTCMH